MRLFKARSEPNPHVQRDLSVKYRPARSTGHVRGRPECPNERLANIRAKTPAPQARRGADFLPASWTYPSSRHATRTWCSTGPAPRDGGLRGAWSTSLTRVNAHWQRTTRTRLFGPIAAQPIQVWSHTAPQSTRKGVMKSGAPVMLPSSFWRCSALLAMCARARTRSGIRCSYREPIQQTGGVRCGITWVLMVEDGAWVWA